MSTLNGHVFRVTDAKQAFTRVILGDQTPTSGYAPWVGLTVTATYYLAGNASFTTMSVAFTGPDGSFSIFDPDPDIPGEPPLPFDSVSLTVEFGFQGFGVPLYRSPVMPIQQAAAKELNIWLYPDTVPASDGITAGTISQQLSSIGLPGDTLIIIRPGAGLQFYGSQGQVDAMFLVSLSADWSPDLATFVDLNLSEWDITVGFPTDIFASAGDVLNGLRSALVQAGNSINPAVLSKMESILEAQEGLPPSLAQEFLTTFTSVTLMTVNSANNNYGWSIGNTSDSTVVLTANPCIGWPRDPSVTDPRK